MSGWPLSRGRPVAASQRWLECGEARCSSSQCSCSLCTCSRCRHRAACAAAPRALRLPWKPREVFKNTGDVFIFVSIRCDPFRCVYVSQFRRSVESLCTVFTPYATHFLADYSTLLYRNECSAVGLKCRQKHTFTTITRCLTAALHSINTVLGFGRTLKQMGLRLTLSLWYFAV